MKKIFMSAAIAASMTTGAMALEDQNRLSVQFTDITTNLSETDVDFDSDSRLYSIAGRSNNLEYNFNINDFDTEQEELGVSIGAVVDLKAGVAVVAGISAKDVGANDSRTELEQYVGLHYDNGGRIEHRATYSTEEVYNYDLTYALVGNIDFVAGVTYNDETDDINEEDFTYRVGAAYRF